MIWAMTLSWAYEGVGASDKGPLAAIAAVALAAPFKIWRRLACIAISCS
jgi:hypothetical protein